MLGRHHRGGGRVSYIWPLRSVPILRGAPAMVISRGSALRANARKFARHRNTLGDGLTVDAVGARQSKLTI